MLSSRGIFLAQGSNPGLLSRQAGSLPLAPPGKPRFPRPCSVNGRSCPGLFPFTHPPSPVSPLSRIRTGKPAKGSAGHRAAALEVSGPGSREAGRAQRQRGPGKGAVPPTRPLRPGSAPPPREEVPRGLGWTGRVARQECPLQHRPDPRRFREAPSPRRLGPGGWGQEAACRARGGGGKAAGGPRGPGAVAMRCRETAVNKACLDSGARAQGLFA